MPCVLAEDHLWSHLRRVKQAAVNGHLYESKAVTQNWAFRGSPVCRSGSCTDIAMDKQRTMRGRSLSARHACWVGHFLTGILDACDAAKTGMACQRYGGTMTSSSQTSLPPQATGGCPEGTQPVCCAKPSKLTSLPDAALDEVLEALLLEYKVEGSRLRC